MKTSMTENPLLKYTLLAAGVIISSFIGSIAALLLVATLIKP